MFAEVVEELNKMSLKTARAAQGYAGPGDVECGVCTGRKYKAVKSCLECLNSYCQNHLQQHDFFFQVNRHNLIDPTRRLHEMICPKHKKYLEIYCRTDQKCICYPCTMEEHKNHETVKVADERTEKQRHLRDTQRKVQQRIQERENELQELRGAIRSHERSAQTEVENSVQFFNGLIRSIERRCSEVTQLIRDQEMTAVSQAERLIEQLEDEISNLRRRNDELQQLSFTGNLIQFLQSFQSLSADPESKVTHNIADRSLLCFPDVGKSFSELKEKIEDLCTQEIEKISDRVSNISVVRPNVPRNRKEFLQYSSQFTLDSNTVNHNLRLSDDDRVATYTDINQQYPYHPDRFDYYPQVLCKESVSGRCYWEVEWSGSNGVLISMSYKSISRKNSENESLLGHNNQSCGVFCCPFSNFTLQLPVADFRAGSVSAEVYPNQYQAVPTGNPPVHNRQTTKVPVASSCPRIGVFVDHIAGTLSFYSVTDTMNLIETLPATFTQPLYPGFYLFKGSTVNLHNHTQS